MTFWQENYHFIKEVYDMRHQKMAEWMENVEKVGKTLDIFWKYHTVSSEMLINVQFKSCGYVFYLIYFTYLLVNLAKCKVIMYIYIVKFLRYFTRTLLPLKFPWLRPAIGTNPEPFHAIHCPKSNPNFRDITWNLVENMILHEISHVFPATFHVTYVYSGKSISFWDSVLQASVWIID